MNLEKLRQWRAANVIEVNGFRLGKMQANEGLEYSNRFLDVTPDAPLQNTVDAYSWLLSKCIVNESGERELDSDEGRAELARLDLQTLHTLGEAAINWNLGDAKKN